MSAELEALAAIKLDWVHGLEDVWRDSPVHVDGVHVEPRRRILAALDRLGERKPPGIVVQGQAGAGKTHLLGWVRQQVERRGGYFFLIGPVSGDAFAESVVSAMLTGLFRTVDGEAEIRRFLLALCAQFRVPAELTSAVVGDQPLEPTHLKDLVVAFFDHDRALARECQHTLRALVLYSSDDYDAQAVGETYLRSMDEQEPGERARRGMQARTRPPMDIARDLSRLLALTGPSVIAVDQVDGVVAELTARDEAADSGLGGFGGSGAVRLNMLADGLLVLHERMERTLCLLACLPVSWIQFRERAVASMRDRFSAIMPLNRLDDPEITARIIERRFQEDFDRIGFAPHYPTWPVARSAFDRAPQYTPRELLQRIDRHIQECLSTGVVRELFDFAAADENDIVDVQDNGDHDITDITVSTNFTDGTDLDGERLDRLDRLGREDRSGGGRGRAADEVGATSPEVLSALDAQFAELRAGAPRVAAVNEDILVPVLLTAGLSAWIIENGGAHDYSLEPMPSTRPALHARLTRTVDADTGEQLHWCFRAITASHGNAILPRITAACTAAAMVAGNPRRRLFLLRNDPWSPGKKVQQALAAFSAAGGRTLRLHAGDLDTFMALRTLLDQRPAGLRAWLASRRPASGTWLLREALGDAAGTDPTGSAALAPRAPTMTPGPGRLGSAGDPDPDPDFDFGPEAEPGPESPPQVAPGPRSAAPAGVVRSSFASADDLGGGVAAPSALTLGTAVRGDAPARIDLAVLRRHVTIFAGSGSGKTVLIRRLVEECALRGVSSIVLDPNNDLARLGDAWPSPPAGWRDGDAQFAAEYLAATDVVIWTPRRDGGRSLTFQPLPDFAGLRDDPDEFEAAIDAAVATLAVRANVTGNANRASLGRAVLTAALRHFARGNRTGLTAFIELLAELPDGVADDLDPAGKRSVELAQTLRAAMVNDPLFGGKGEPVDPGTLLVPAPGQRARVSVISLVGLQHDEQRQSFVNQLQLALFSWVKRNPAGNRPLGGLFVMDEAQTFAPSGPSTACTTSTLALASQARKYGLGLVFATQAPKNLHNGIPGNATTQMFGRLNAPVQIEAARMMARACGGDAPDIGRLAVGEFYATSETLPFMKIRTPMCLSHHPPSPLTAEEVITRARPDLTA
ncbi:protein of unknown function DUF87 [Parafrankia sp. EAN1pec]|uniref:helicase HerA domain-containing protein n=1 Tax=Parafrankia sp. (strain EAN1pec) TaxID=298653 RepID=UPI0000544968|nr:protein of unknown function DUF87 [Frankia sp. EAN1pec]